MREIISLRVRPPRRPVRTVAALPVTLPGLLLYGSIAFVVLSVQLAIDVGAMLIAIYGIVAPLVVKTWRSYQDWRA